MHKLASQLFIGSILLCSSFAFSQSAQVNRLSWTEKDYWFETQLNFEMIVGGPGINSEVCLNDFLRFTACVDGLSKGVSFAKNDGHYYFLKPKSGSDGINGFELIGSKFADEADMQAKINENTKILKQWFEEYKSNLVLAPMDFDKSYADFKRLYVNDSNEAFLSAKIFNAFLAKAADPHTYITPTKLMEQSSKGSETMGGEKGIFGIGMDKLAYLGEDKILVKEVYKGSPAELAGLEAGDIILSANQKTSFDEEVKALADNKTVELLVDGSSGKRSLTVSKAVFDVDTVQSSLHKSVSGHSVGYIKFSTFMDENGCEKIVEAGESLKDRGVEALILDLRNNGGGLVPVAQCINGQFLEQGSLLFVSQNLQNGEFTPIWNSSESGAFRSIHTAVLINGGSASASEVVSTYLQSYRKAFIVGESSFGKGTMQSIGPITPTILMAQTVAKYYGPDGVSPQLQGVTPDILAYPSITQKEASKYSRERDLYSNAINNRTDKPETMKDREQQVAAVKNCLTTSDAAFKSYDKKDEFKKRVHDHQKSVAIATLECALELKIPVFKSTDIPSFFHKK
jgi:carboxyl-terminal processing protease